MDSITASPHHTGRLTEGRVADRRRAAHPRFLTVDLRFQHADERQVAVPAKVVKAVPDDKLVRDLKTAVINRHVPQPAWDLVQQGAHLETGWVTRFQGLE